MNARSFVLTVLTLGWSAGWSLAGTWEPVDYSLERYEHIWKSSPFVAATETAPKGGSIALRYSVTGFAQIGDTEMVFLFDRIGLSRFSVTKDTPENGVELLEVAEQTEVSPLGAKIRVNGEVAEISYDASLATSDMTTSPARNGSQAPSIPPPPNGQNLQNSQGVVAPGSPVQVSEKAAVPRPTRVIRRRPLVVQ